MPSSDLVLSYTCFAAALYLYFSPPSSESEANANEKRTVGSQITLPPGPKPIPLLGNVLDLSPKELWLKAEKWARTYGPVTYLHVLSIPLIFINSAEAASDLLEQRGAIYADKPNFVMAGELCGCSNMVAFTPYSPQLKRQRRLLHKAFAASVIPTYWPLIKESTTGLVGGLMRQGEKKGFYDQIKRYAGSITLNVVYGYDVGAAGRLRALTSRTGGEGEDPFLKLADECVDILSKEIASGGGVWLVDVLPWLKNIPPALESLPLMGFKQKARVWKKKMEEFVDKPWEWCLGSMQSNTHKPSFCSTLLEDLEFNPKDKQTKAAKEEFEFDLKWTANSMYSASIDTTLTTLANFIICMIKFPEVQRRAQAEIDQVLGSGPDGERLPTFEDRSKLVYCEALFKESLRWGCVVPMSLPHRVMEDDIYNGMLIPKGSLVFANIWAMMRDPEVFEDPERFLPERYLEVDVPEVDGQAMEETKEKTYKPRQMSKEMERKMNPRNFVFGFGRRQCPGKDLVNDSIWLAMISLLSIFSFSLPQDSQGHEQPLKPEYDNPIFRLPKEFECDIRPRSERSVRIAMREVEDV